MINIKDTFILVTSIALLISAGFLNEALIKPDLDIKKQDSAVNINSDFLKLFSAGNSRLISDLLWITTLLESDHDHYKQKDLNSWMYLRFKTIATLDPLFLQNYQFGGKYLSIIKDDIYGAKEIFDKGLDLYPEDYELLFNAAYLYAFELQDSKNGFELYDKVSRFKKAPKFITTLKYRLKYEKDRNLELAFKVLSSSLQVETDKHLIDKMKKDLYAIKAELDLECLNSSKKKCSKIDYNGNLYINENGSYKSRLNFTKYGLKKLKEN
jgi:hypothetical protein